MPGFVMPLGAGLVSGLLFATLFAGVPFLGMVSILPLLMVGLAEGVRGAFFASVFGGLVVAALSSGAPEGVLSMVLTAYVVFDAVPALVLVGVAAKPGPEGWCGAGPIVLRVTLMGVLLLLVTVWLLNDLHGSAADAVLAQTEAMLAAFMKQAPMPLEPSAVAALVAPKLLGLGLWSWLTRVLLFAALAQALLSRWQRSLRPTPRYIEIDVPWRLYGMLAVAVLVWQLGGGDWSFAAYNAALVLLVPPALQGLAAAHKAAAGTARPRLVLTVIYVVLLLAFMALGSDAMSWGLALAGALEQWIRSRRADPDQDDDEEDDEDGHGRDPA